VSKRTPYWIRIKKELDVMDSPVTDAAPKDRVFRAIGRNLVNLQRLEKILKQLSELRPVAGKLPEIKAQLEHRRRSTERTTLGAVIPLWLETARGRKPRLPTRTTDLDILCSYWLKIGISQHVLDEHAKELDQLLIERNWFVHHGLAEIDYASSEECENLLARLDDQNRQVGKQIDFLLYIVNRIREFCEFFARDEIQEFIQRELLSESVPNDT
jgi:hypothetical protein